MHEGSTNPGLMQELWTATDFALRATKVTARSLGKAMSTMVVQEHHLDDQSWISESWTGLYTSSRSRCGRAGALSNASSPRFAAIDLKDAYFHVSILLQHRPFLRFAFEDRAWKYRVLPFWLPLSPRVFTKVVEGALAPLQEVGVRILNYLDDWLILAL